MRMRKAFGERNPLPIGIVGSVIIVVAVLAALNVNNLPFVDSGKSYTAVFTETGGLESGDTVQVAGIDVGEVTDVALDNDRVKISFDVTDDGVHLGSRTSARISVLTLLGKHGLVLTSVGSGTLPEGSTIPDTRTTPPYDITDALSQLTTTSSELDTESFAQALTTITATLKHTPKSLGTTVRAVQRIADAISGRDAEIHSLFAATSNVTAILDQRTAQLTTLLSDGSQLLAVINARRAAVTTLLTSATDLADQLNGLVDDNQKDFRAAVTELNKAVTLLNNNKKSLDQALEVLGPFGGQLGEIVAAVPGFQAYVANLFQPLDIGGVTP